MIHIYYTQAIKLVYLRCKKTSRRNIFSKVRFISCKKIHSLQSIVFKFIL